jgi:uncharacterized protein (DUF2132 family)
LRFFRKFSTIHATFRRFEWSFNVNAPANSDNPLHGVTLAMMLEQLVERYGWEEMSRQIPVRCFLFEPSIKSSLTFLRKTPWARAKVETLYLGLVAQ